MGWYNYGFRPYVPVAKRRAKAASYAAKLAKKEKRILAPIELAGRCIAASFWGKAWCENLERYSDFENRLPRGRTYIRNGSVIDLRIERGKVKAIVSGSDIYHVTVAIETVPKGIWTRIKRECVNSIASLIDLLQGRFDEGVMRRLSQREGGLFPQPKEIKMTCSCPDWAGMCKHVAAVLYGVGARLDTQPELLFTLRHVDHLELVSQAADSKNLDESLQGKTDSALAGSDLGEMFGIELDTKKGRSTGKAKTKATSPESSSNPPTSRPRIGKKLAKVGTKRGRPRRAVLASSRAQNRGHPVHIRFFTLSM